MKYSLSTIDKKLKNWFTNDFDRNHLRRIFLEKGRFRGLTEVDLSFDFPITAIAGKNGTGKSTILALACCAYHNLSEGYKALNRKQTYYTFADFFIQHKEEVPPQGISIRYHFAYNKLRISPDYPDGKGVAYQIRHKAQNGKWNEYAGRVIRNTIFVGIERIIPHSEKSQSRSYCRQFKEGAPAGWEEKVASIVGFILGKKYDEFKVSSHSKYRLPIAKFAGTTISGFNMGAGESALFEIFTTIFSCPEGSLFVIDEIELGLHIEAQKRLIKKLKEVCLERKAQIICTTHSSEIFECLPDEARIFLEKVNNKTIATTGVSAEHAFSKLSAENSRELDILVEDDVAKTLIALAIPTNLRSRVNIESIGSASALSIQLAATYKRKNKKNTIAIFDGDQRNKEGDNFKKAKSILEKEDNDFITWLKARVSYLPGTTWPEAWILETSKTLLTELSLLTKTPEDNILDVIESGIESGKHNEFYSIGKDLSLSTAEALSIFCMTISKEKPEHFNKITEIIIKNLD
ncbi:ATP-dependent nuclease [Pseudomonas citronellolis]|uniref:ATP-dependent nuclease n=1 Tax=Pseudomonas citronellolis TaxID=53408 RepID=UPI003C30E48F